MQPPVPTPVQVPTGVGIADAHPLSKVSVFDLVLPAVQSVSGSKFSNPLHLPGTGWKPFIGQSVAAGAAMTGTIQCSTNNQDPWTVESGFADVAASTASSEGKTVTNSKEWWRHKIAATGSVQVHAVAAYAIAAADDFWVAEKTWKWQAFMSPCTLKNFDANGQWAPENYSDLACFRDLFPADGSSLPIILVFACGRVLNGALQDLEIIEGADLTVDVQVSANGTSGWTTVTTLTPTFHSPSSDQVKLTINQNDMFLRLHTTSTGIPEAKWEVASEIYCLV